MEWYELAVRVAAENAGAAEDIAQLAAPGGFSVEDYTDLEAEAANIAHSDLIDGELLSRDRSSVTLRCYFSSADERRAAEDFIRERLAGNGIPAEFSHGSARDSDWADAWKKYFHPTPVGDRLLICPRWEQPGDTGGRVTLYIDPGAAFGSGAHETTRLCLALLQKYLSAGAGVLDIGCGSGILGVAAALLGARSVAGVDIDPTAVKVSRENAEQNGVAGVCRFMTGDLASGVGGRYDLVLSNIVADAVISLAPAVKGLLRPGGVWICSGVVENRRAEVEAALGTNNYKLTEKAEERGWYAFAVTEG